MKYIALVSLVAALPVCLPAAAQSPWYAGASAGLARTDRELVENRESTITHAADLRTDFDDEDGAWKLFAGMRFNPVFALEVTYADLGSHRMVTRMAGGNPPLPAQITINRRISGYGVDLVATPPLGFERVRVFGRAGSFRARLQADASLEGNIVFSGATGERFRSTTIRETVFKAGIGAEWQVTPRLSVRLELERYHGVGRAFRIGGSGTTGEADTEVYSLGALLRF